MISGEREKLELRQKGSRSVAARSSPSRGVARMRTGNADLGNEQREVGRGLVAGTWWLVVSKVRTRMFNVARPWQRGKQHVISLLSAIRETWRGGLVTRCYCSKLSLHLTQGAWALMRGVWWEGQGWTLNSNCTPFHFWRHHPPFVVWRWDRVLVTPLPPPLMTLYL